MFPKVIVLFLYVYIIIIICIYKMYYKVTPYYIYYYGLINILVPLFVGLIHFGSLIIFWFNLVL